MRRYKDLALCSWNSCLDGEAGQSHLQYISQFSILQAMETEFNIRYGVARQVQCSWGSGSESGTEPSPWIEELPEPGCPKNTDLHKGIGEDPEKPPKRGSPDEEVSITSSMAAQATAYSLAGQQSQVKTQAQPPSVSTTKQFHALFSP